MEILLKQLNEAGVRYFVIGGQAMLQDGMPRFTLDWDLFIPLRDEANFERINTVLDEELDIPLVPFDPASGEGFVQTYQTQYGIIQFHQVLPGLPKFDIVEERSVIHDYRGIPVKYLCLDDLLSSKLAVARDKDSDDILFLQMKKEAEKDEIPMRKEYDFPSRNLRIRWFSFSVTSVIFSIHSECNPCASCKADAPEHEPERQSQTA